MQFLEFMPSVFSKRYEVVAKWLTGNGKIIYSGSNDWINWEIYIRA